MWILWAGVLGVALATTWQSQPARTSTDFGKLGPQVGQSVPEFSLPDQNGTTRTLESILGSAGAMLVFFRSADW